MKKIVISAIAFFLADSLNGNPRLWRFMTEDLNMQTHFSASAFLPMGSMANDVPAFALLEGGYFGQINDSRFHFGVNQGFGQHGNERREIQFFHRDEWLTAESHVKDKVNLTYATLRVDIVQNVRSTPFLEGSLGIFEMKTTKSVERFNPGGSDHQQKLMLEDTLYSSDTIMYGGRFGVRLQADPETNPGSSSPTLDLFVGWVRGGMLTHTSHSAPHGGNTPRQLTIADDGTFRYAPQPILQSRYHGTRMYTNPLSGVQIGVRLQINL
ncbi:MAG: hypothetical protein EA392_14375 [Cryomorphaceae bacterium]|nr:MAG: hypothetical protein EA392_14375 [Cryomorphaceae bacterium]